MRNKVLMALAAVGMMMSVVNAAVVSENGIAKDSVTGLMWQDDADAATVQKDFDGAQQYCQDLDLGGKCDWRLPNIYELSTLLDNTKSKAPCIINGFQNIISESYWSSTTTYSLDYTHNKNAYIIWPGDGRIDSLYKLDTYFIRCVRGKQLNFENLVILKKSGKVKVSQKYIDVISPKEEASRKKEAQQSSSSSTQYSSRNVSSTDYKITGKSDIGDRILYDISCSNGNRGIVNYYPKNAEGSKYYGTSNGNMLDYGNRTFDEAANSICGNR
jgi:hypothetical protein